MFPKAKKIWRKKFSKEELKELWDVFIHISGLSKEEWENTEFVPHLISSGHYPHPETDVYDDTVGIHPKRIAKAIELGLTIHQIGRLLEAMKYAHKYDQKYPLDEDGFIDWDAAFKQEVIVPLKNGEKDVVKLASAISGVEERMLLQALRESDGDMSGALDLCKSLRQLLIAKNFKEEWKEAFGRIPKEPLLLKVNPENFSYKIFSAAMKKLGVEFSTLGTAEKARLVVLTMLLGKNIAEVSKGELEHWISSSESFYSWLDLAKRANEESIPEIKRMATEPMVRYIPRVFLGAHGISVPSDVKMETLNMIKTAILSGIDPEKIKQIPFSVWGRVVNYNVTMADLRSLFEIYERRCEEHYLPEISGSLGKYSYRILDKSDPVGLFLGYATDCCQVIGNSGEGCIWAGYMSPYAGFFSIEKKGKVYIQSFVWTFTHECGEKVLVFDSIEAPGKQKNKKAVSALMEAIEKIIDQGWSVIVSLDGYKLPEGLRSQIEEEIKKRGLKDVDLYIPQIAPTSLFRDKIFGYVPGNFANPYSDAKGDGVFIVGNEDNELYHSCVTEDLSKIGGEDEEHDDEHDDEY